MIMIAVMLPLSSVAQDISSLAKLTNEYKQLLTQIKELNNSIMQEEEKAYALRLSWYNTCKEYLQKGELRAEELESLINQTVPEIDGQDLFEELLRAKQCLNSGKEYWYKEIPAPTWDYEVDPVAPSSQDEPILTDPSEDRPGETKPGAPVVNKDTDNDDETNPVITPVMPDPRTVNPSKVEKRRDKGEMEEGTSKKPKNNDGSR